MPKPKLPCIKNPEEPCQNCELLLNYPTMYRALVDNPKMKKVDDFKGLCPAVAAQQVSQAFGETIAKDYGGEVSAA